MAREVLLLACCVSAFVFGYSFIPRSIENIRRIKTAIEFQDCLNERDLSQPCLSSQERQWLRWLKGASYYIFRNGCGFPHVASSVLRVPCCYRSIDAAYKLAQWKGIECSHKSLASLGIFVLLVITIMSALVLHSIIATFSVVFIVLGMSQVFIMHQEAKREDALRYQVPDAMRSLSACFHAGYSLPQAFLQTSKESSSPSKELFARVAHDVNIGTSVHDALKTFKQSSGVPELAFVAVALDIQHVSGGSVGPILELAENSVTRSLELKRFLRTQTAQARFSARVVSGVPLVLILILSLSSPSFLSPFFESGQGFALLALAFGLQLFGILIIRRLLDVGVG